MFRNVFGLREWLVFAWNKNQLFEKTFNIPKLKNRCHLRVCINTVAI